MRPPRPRGPARRLADIRSPGSSSSGVGGGAADAARRLDPRLRRHRAAAGRSGERDPRAQRDAGEPRRGAGADGPRPPGRRALRRLARRAAHGRSRQLGGGLRAGRRAADLGRGRGQARRTRSCSPRSRRCCSWSRSRCCFGVLAALRAGRRRRPRDLPDLARDHLAARVRARLAADPRSSSPGSTCCRRSSLIPPGTSPLVGADEARPAGADAARRDAARPRSAWCAPG